jgi:hypothetical protein
MFVEIVLGVDGGNSKTELLAASLDGDLLARARGPGNNVHFAGVEATVEFLGRLVAEAGLGASAVQGVFYLCGVDVPADREALAAALSARPGWSARRSTTTSSGCCAPAPTRATRSQWSAAPASTAPAARPTRGWRATRR